MLAAFKRFLGRARSCRGCAVVAAALITGAAWLAVVPPFEGPDELFFYTQALRLSDHPQSKENLFYKLSTPIIRLYGPNVETLSARYNPAFRFVSNARGEVNRFVHDRAVAAREHVRTLIALRCLVVLLSALTALLIYGIASLCLDEPALRWIVVGLSLWIPQVSFMNVIAQREAITQVLGAAVALVIVARVTARLNRWSAAALLVAAIALTPFADRQAYFLVPFAVIGLIVAERGWLARGLTAAGVAVPALAAAWLVSGLVEAGTDLRPWLAILRHPFQPFAAANDGVRVPSLAGYYLFEFLPKLFMGFWGWIGLPSILLPAPLYGTLAALSLLALGGLVSRLFRAGKHEWSPDESRRAAARRVLGVGGVIMLGPILYGPVIADFNLWYGRWLFPMLGPIAIAFVLGLAEIVGLARRYPRRVASAVAIVAIGASILWTGSLGDSVRAGITATHYGDRARLIESIRDAILALGATSILVWILGTVRLPTSPIAPHRLIVAGMAGMNAALLFGFVAPLYAPLTPTEYVDLIEKYSANRELTRAADLYASAIKSYPSSPQLAELGERSPRLLLGGRLDEMIGLLQRGVAHGAGLRDRDTLLALAARLRGATWNGSGVLDAALTDAEKQPELAEPVALVRMALARRAYDRDAASALIEAGHGRRLMMPIRNGEVLLEGYTVYPHEDDGTQLIVYLRPTTNDNNRRLWLHAYPELSEDYLTLEPTITADGWQPGELIWQVFELPKGRFNTFLGVWVGTDIGAGKPLGVLPP